MACKKQTVKVYQNMYETYSCGKCEELHICEKQEGVAERRLMGLLKFTGEHLKKMKEDEARNTIIKNTRNENTLIKCGSCAYIYKPYKKTSFYCSFVNRWRGTANRTSKKTPACAGYIENDHVEKEQPKEIMCKKCVKGKRCIKSMI